MEYFIGFYEGDMVVKTLKNRNRGAKSGETLEVQANFPLSPLSPTVVPQIVQSARPKNNFRLLADYLRRLRKHQISR